MAVPHLTDRGKAGVQGRPIVKHKTNQDSMSNISKQEKLVLQELRRRACLFDGLRLHWGVQERHQSRGILQQ
jgi:hypothetical protein